MYTRDDCLSVQFGEHTVYHNGVGWTLDLEYRGSTISLASTNPHVLREFLREKVAAADSTVEECAEAIPEWSYVRLWEIWTVTKNEGPYRMSKDDWLVLHGLVRYEEPGESWKSSYPEERFYPPRQTKKGIALADLLFGPDEDLPHDVKRETRRARIDRIGPTVYGTNGIGSVGFHKPFIAFHWRDKVHSFHETAEEAIQEVSGLDEGITYVLRVQNGFSHPPGPGYRVNKYYRSQCTEHVWGEELEPWLRK